MSVQEQNEITPLIAEEVNDLEGNVNCSSNLTFAQEISIIRNKLDHKKFIATMLVSLLIYALFLMSFAPRSSPSRDFKWWHSTPFSDAEVYRIFLSALEENFSSVTQLNHYGCKDHQLGDDAALNYTIKQLQLMNFDVIEHRYYPWVTEHLDTDVLLKKNGTVIYEASLMEPFLFNEDGLYGGTRIKGFHAYSAKGEVEAQYVFCNYGTLEDYSFLISTQVDLEGKIHILRNGKLLQGLKVKNAELYGAVGVISYNDYNDDGEINRRNGFKSYPKGKARNLNSIQWGSVLYYSDFFGDPTVPESSSKYKDVERLSPEGKIPRIPSIPMSANETEQLLLELNHKGIQLCDDKTLGDYKYYTGPSEVNVTIRMRNENKHAIKAMTNIEVEIPGIFRDEEILIGSHRDTFLESGVGDSSSGSAILLEMARGFSLLASKGWKPMRSIRLLSWDGSAPGMLGSTEHSKEFAGHLMDKTLVYLNIDKAVTGSKFACHSNPLLSEVIQDAAKLIRSPFDESQSLRDIWINQTNGKIETLSGTSDYAPFQYKLGIPSASIGFHGNRMEDAVFHQHSSYSTVSWLEKYVDPDYKLHSTLSRFIGIVTLMISEVDTVSFNLTIYITRLRKELSAIRDECLSVFEKNEILFNQIDMLLDIIQEIETDIAPTFDKYRMLVQEEWRKALPFWMFPRKIILYLQLHRMNRRVKQVDRLFITTQGLTERPCLKYSILAPQKQTGLTGVFFPSLIEAILDDNTSQAQLWVDTYRTQFLKLKSILA